MTDEEQAEEIERLYEANRQEYHYALGIFKARHAYELFQLRAKSRAQKTESEEQATVLLTALASVSDLIYEFTKQCEKARLDKPSRWDIHMPDAEYLLSDISEVLTDLPNKTFEDIQLARPFVIETGDTKYKYNYDTDFSEFLLEEYMKYFNTLRANIKPKVRNEEPE